MTARARPLPLSDPRPLQGWRETAGAYFALTKPRIIELLLVTTFPAMVVAENGLPNLWLALATLIGGSLSAGGANTINCVIDRDIDAIMRRTQHRPIPAGLIAPERALIFGISLGVISFAFMTITVNLLTASLALAALLFYVFVYTMWLKRTTVENIVIGGAAGAVPPLCGWAAVTGSLELAPLIMFGIVFFWTPPHFWALAIGYTNDYASANIPMLPVTHGAREARRRSMVYALAMVALSLTLYATDTVGWVYLAAALISGAIFIALAAAQLVQASTRAAMNLFRYSMAYLSIIFVAMVVDRLVSA